MNHTGRILFTASSPDQIRRPAKLGDVGYDLCASEDRVIQGFHHGYIKTGVRICLPQGVWARIVGRSSTFRNKRLVVVESTIDNGYTGELTIPVYNTADCHVIIQKGDRIAQLTLHEIVLRQMEMVQELPTTERGTDAFGSTGH